MAEIAVESPGKDTFRILALEFNVSSMESGTIAEKETVAHFGQLVMLLANAAIC